MLYLLHLQGLGSLVIIDPPAVKQKAQRCDGHTNLEGRNLDTSHVHLKKMESHPLAVTFLQFPHLGGLLHPEVDLIRVLTDDFKLDVFGIVPSHCNLGTWL